MTIAYRFDSDPYYEQTIDLGGHLYVKAITFNVTCSPDDTTQVYGFKSTEAKVSTSTDVFNASGVIYNPVTSAYGTDFIVVHGSANADQVIGRYGASDYGYMLHGTSANYGLALLQFAPNPANSFIANTTLRVTDLRTKYLIGALTTNTQTGTAHLTHWLYNTLVGSNGFGNTANDIVPPGAVPVNPDINNGDTVRLYKRDGSVYSEHVVSNVSPAGYFPSGGGGFTVVQQWSCDLTPITLGTMGHYGGARFVTAPTGGWGGYFQLVRRADNSVLQGNGFIAFGYVDNATEFYVAGINAVDGTWRIGRYNPVSMVFTSDIAFPEATNMLSLDVNISLSSSYDSATNTTEVILRDGTSEKARYTYSGQIYGRVGLFNYKSQTTMLGISLQFPVGDTGENVAMSRDWTYTTDNNIVVVGRRARQLVVSAKFSPKNADRFIKVPPAINSIYIDAVYSDTVPIQEDSAWSTLPWHTVTSGQTVDLPAGRYTQLRFTLRA